jgi:peptide deformylase
MQRANPNEMPTNILRLGDPRLRQPSDPLDMSDKPGVTTIWSLLKDTLDEVMKRHVFQNCAGLAAVQIGIMRRACVIWLPESGFHYIGNPVLLSQSRETSLQYEGCYSFFEKRGLVPRPLRVRASYCDQGFHGREEEFAGWAARILLHEVDHMEGRIYTDRMRSCDTLLTYDEYLMVRASDHLGTRS